MRKRSRPMVTISIRPSSNGCTWAISAVQPMAWGVAGGPPSAVPSAMRTTPNGRPSRMQSATMAL